MSRDHRDLHVMTHSFPTRCSADLTVREGFIMGDNEGRFDAALDRILARIDDLEVFARELDRTYQARIAEFHVQARGYDVTIDQDAETVRAELDRKSTRLNSSH